jgi:hypothetical protein
MVKLKRSLITPSCVRLRKRTGAFSPAVHFGQRAVEAANSGAASAFFHLRSGHITHLLAGRHVLARQLPLLFHGQREWRQGRRHVPWRHLPHFTMPSSSQPAQVAARVAAGTQAMARH